MKKIDKNMERVSSRKIQGIKRFQPGDLVTAEHLNEIIDAIESLQERIKKLEERCK